MRCTMQDVFREHGASFAASRTLHPREARAAWAITHCYGPECGSHWEVCPNGDFEREQFHACGHRSCPRCAERPRQRWADAELARLLPCPHFHVVFTLPHGLLELWQRNRSLMAQWLFDAARSSLLELLADPRHLGATPGILLSLHTWGRNLSRHPHVHCLVSAGGLDALQRWLPTRPGFLLPLAPLRKLFAGKLLGRLAQALDDAALCLPCAHSEPSWRSVLQRLYRAHWNIQINPPYSSGRSVALYLARYARGGPLPAHRALSLHHDRVAFDYTDHRDHKVKSLCLHPHEFISRILWHAPPKGLHTVRHAGLYASAARCAHRDASIALAIAGAAAPLSPTASVRPLSTHSPPAVPRICPRCHTTLKLVPCLRRSSKNQFHLLQSAPRAPTEHPGPTLRSTGPPTAGRAIPRSHSRHAAAAC
jgi:hypothetical protein